MKYAMKHKQNLQHAYILGADSAMERTLLATGAICARGGGEWELFSREAQDGVGERAHDGDYFKVDEENGHLLPYPIPKRIFESIHRKVGEGLYEQLPQRRPMWQKGDIYIPEVVWLLEQGRLELHPEEPQRYFRAHLWGAPLSAPEDAVLVIYGAQRDAEGAIVDVDFNFVVAVEFARHYVIVEE